MSRSAPAGILKSMKAKIHVAKKELGLSDEAYRLVLESITGKDSTKSMTLGELDAVLEAFKSKGFKVTVKRREVNNDPRLKKIWALWYALADAGKCDRTAKALNGFVKKQIGVENMNWLQFADQFEAVIEGLKAWCNREGVVLS